MIGDLIVWPRTGNTRHANGFTEPPTLQVADPTTGEHWIVPLVPNGWAKRVRDASVVNFRPSLLSAYAPRVANVFLTYLCAPHRPIDIEDCEEFYACVRDVFEARRVLDKVTPDAYPKVQKRVSEYPEISEIQRRCLEMAARSGGAK